METLIHHYLDLNIKDQLSFVFYGVSFVLGVARGIFTRLLHKAVVLIIKGFAITFVLTQLLGFALPFKS